jgi:hypothetical protein
LLGDYKNLTLPAAVMPITSDIVRKDWWWLAVVVCVLWSIEGVIEGNTVREILVGPVLVSLWACVVYFIDRWVMKVANRKETRTPG